MKELKDILFGVSIESVYGSTAIGVENLHFDSRSVRPNSAFFAIRGTVADGHEFIRKALHSGASAVIGEKLPAGDLPKECTFIVVKDSREALAIMASNFYEKPSENLKLTGVTGTNGKTTIATLLYELFSKAGYKVGLISTVAIKVDETTYPTKLTTPDSITINKYLRLMNEEGVEFCFMEVSSHGISQQRTKGLKFTGGIYTNLSHDHLDYHKDFAEYRDVKKAFFDDLSTDAFALTNKDDKNGMFMFQNCRAKTKTYALKTMADFKARILEDGFDGMLLDINGNEVWTKLIGGFNAYNLLAIYAGAALLGLKEEETLKLLSELGAVEGRFEYFISPLDRITAIVDYAHTPDALKNVLNTINTIRTNNESLITVVGCGGDRDKTKRPKMGDLAAKLSNKVIFTSDNPRTEDPAEIISEIEKGVAPQDFNKTISIVDRRQAIKTACTMANKDDIILIAGKGHETYQEVNGKRHHFDDMEIVSDFLKIMKK